MRHIDLGLYLIRKRQQELEEVEISDWTTIDNHIHTCFADNKRKKEQVGWKIRNSLLNVVNGKVPACGMDWQNAYKCEIKVYNSMVSLIPDEILKEEIALLSITIPNFSTPSTFMKKVFTQTIAAGEAIVACSLKYIELLSAEIPLATCTSQNMPFFWLKLAVEIAWEDAYMT
ncbi:hypothetical protein Prudu_001699 [Prunus dulcis]|uniref:Uncharacterized protein n=1 Tax=Prunus dulcis TaxID=3755 RepID=A0A4Y1QP98_PRUDU|nr:hypothetical protein Prudu_001699 [Prunus dulcis]